MSAKRMKTPLPRQERRLGALPIPSFSNAIDDASPTSSPIPPPLPQPPSSTTTTTIKPQWNKDRLLKIEVALQLHVKSQQKRGEQSTGHLLPLSEFYALTHKVGSSSSHSSLVSDATALEQSAHLDLSTEERDSYDLLCAASPNLYKLVQRKRQELPAWKYASKMDSSSQDETKVWCLEVVPVAGNRMQALHKLLAQTALEETKSQDILRVIRAHRDDQKAEAGSSVVVDSKPKAVESFLRPGMNIDERVRARADAKEQHREQLEAKASTNGSAGGISSNTQTDRTWLVRLADSLWFHSSHIMKRQDHFRSPRDKKKGSSCVLTLKDIVEVLSRPAATTSSRVPTHVNKSEKLTKREIVRAVQELRNLVPDWIHFVDTSSDDDKGHGLSKDTTVWLKPVDYQGVRARLTGQQQHSEKAGTTAAVALAPIWKKRPPPSLSGAARPQQPPGRPLAQPPRPFNKRSLFATPAEGTSTSSRVVTEESTTGSLDDRSALHPQAKRTRIEIPRAEDYQHQHQRSAVSASVAGVKRSAPDAPSTPPVHHAANKKPRGLRINPNLILTDADYTGGEVIQASQFDSPRGLKILFSQMNSGKRI